ncbi:hypothetical protein V8G54_008551 [Vigna mungo]|uniref:Uncharacterized protein n=1 Tax=Vigna mungo TaxID=3915 RepID=A0AAQ3SA56_VIGMU
MSFELQKGEGSNHQNATKAFGCNRKRGCGDCGHLRTLLEHSWSHFGLFPPFSSHCILHLNTCSSSCTLIINSFKNHNKYYLLTQTSLTNFRDKINYLCLPRFERVSSTNYRVQYHY